MAVVDSMNDERSNPLAQLSINTIRTLAMDAVQEANSGHPGTAMAMAPVAYCLWQKDERGYRDRFALDG